MKPIEKFIQSNDIELICVSDNVKDYIKHSMCHICDKPNVEVGLFIAYPKGYVPGKDDGAHIGLICRECGAGLDCDDIRSEIIEAIMCHAERRSK